MKKKKTSRHLSRFFFLPDLLGLQLDADHSLVLGREGGLEELGAAPVHEGGHHIVEHRHALPHLPHLYPRGERDAGGYKIRLC